MLNTVKSNIDIEKNILGNLKLEDISWLIKWTILWLLLSSSTIADANGYNYWNNNSYSRSSSLNIPLNLSSWNFSKCTNYTEEQLNKVRLVEDYFKAQLNIYLKPANEKILKWNLNTLYSSLEEINVYILEWNRLDADTLGNIITLLNMYQSYIEDEDYKINLEIKELYFKRSLVNIEKAKNRIRLIKSQYAKGKVNKKLVKKFTTDLVKAYEYKAEKIKLGNKYVDKINSLNEYKVRLREAITLNNQVKWLYDKLSNDNSKQTRRCDKPDIRANSNIIKSKKRITTVKKNKEIRKVWYIKINISYWDSLSKVLEWMWVWNRKIRKYLSTYSKDIARTNWLKNIDDIEPWKLLIPNPYN